LEERTEKIEKYSIKVSDLYGALFYDFDIFLHEGINGYMEAVKAQVIKLKEYFKEEFDKLDKDIKSKYEELTQTTKDQKKKEEELEHNKKVLEWIEVCQTEINEALDI
jgi:Skp family chaperone for outer membrane proteins